MWTPRCHLRLGGGLLASLPVAAEWREREGWNSFVEEEEEEMMEVRYSTLLLPTRVGQES